jgi:hypothetical protein
LTGRRTRLRAPRTLSTNDSKPIRHDFSLAARPESMTPVLQVVRRVVIFAPV